MARDTRLSVHITEVVLSLIRIHPAVGILDLINETIARGTLSLIEKKKRFLLQGPRRGSSQMLAQLLLPLSEASTLLFLARGGTF